MILVSSESSTWRSAPKSQKLTFKKILRPSKQLRAKNEFSHKYANYTVRIVMGLGKVVDRVLTSQSQVNLYKKKFSNSERNPLRVEKSGLHRKKSTFRLFLTAASYSPLRKTRK